MSEVNKNLESLGEKVKTPTHPFPATPAPSATLSKSPTKKTYYARLDGCRYCFSDGGIAIFVNGMYDFDPMTVPEDYLHPDEKVTPTEGWTRRHRELEYQVNNPNPVFSKVPVAIQRSDAIVLREVGHAGGGTGIVGSFAAQANLRQST